LRWSRRTIARDRLAAVRGSSLSSGNFRGTTKNDLHSNTRMTEPPSRLISQIGPTGDDYFGPSPRHAGHVDPGLSDQGMAAGSVSY
jgi:hypothetical protein